MAVDKKSQHVGNHGGVYTDMDGMSKQFTYIDHDKKPMVSAHVEKKDKKQMSQEASYYRTTVVNRILDISASLAPKEYQDFTIRGEGVKTITWNQKMLLNQGIDISRLRDLCTMLENRMEIIK
jgi:hypothetical protein